MLRACHKRPISVNQINQLVDEVETEIFNREEKEIPSSLIGELVMDKLKDLEAVATSVLRRCTVSSRTSTRL